MMRKLKITVTAALACSLCLGLLGLVACSASAPDPAPATPSAVTPPTAAVDVRVVALKGPTAMGMVKMMDQADSGQLTTNNYNFQITATIDEVPPLLVKGDVDIAAVPANLAAVLYNNTKGEVQVLAINTLGVLYLVENGEAINSVQDLKGKTIYASGKGATPEYALNHVLTQAQIDPANDLTLEWLPEHSAVVAALAQDPDAVALLPQPFVTTAQIQNPSIRIAIDLNKEWENSSQGGSLVTGALVARRDFIEKNPLAIADFLANYAASVDFVNNNVDSAAALVGKYDIVPEAVAKKAILLCNIVCITGSELQTQLNGYLEVLEAQNPQSIGGALPGDDFYDIS